MNQYSFFDNLSEKAKVEYKDVKIFDISVMTSKQVQESSSGDSL